MYVSDIDKCAAGTYNCDANAECINTSGSYTCSCKTGYHGDGENCEGQSFIRRIKIESKKVPAVLASLVILH